MTGCRIGEADGTTTGGADWAAWHRAYDDPRSSLSRRLALVRATLVSALDATPPGPIRLLSVCAGDGRDVLGVLEHHGRAGDVDATLVDLDAALVESARRAAASNGLSQVTCAVGDAGQTSWYEAARPIGVLVACGVFGNIEPEDLHATILAFGAVVAPGGHVIWTRHRRPPDQTPEIRRWFASAGFAEVTFDQVADSLASVGCHRRTTEVVEPTLPTRLFEFVGDGAAAHL
jgi:Methyltransferase domain